MSGLKKEKPKVSLCIPTWQGESVIQTALSCASEQSHDNLEIIVSIDKSDDETESIIRAHGAKDERVKIYTHHERMGWAKNANFTLSRATSPYYAFYFHDDRIEQNFVERLLTVLEENPEAGSVYCDITEGEWINRGQDHAGSPFERMMMRLVGPNKGSPLRALTRRSSVGPNLRLPEGSHLGFHIQHAYLLDLVAAAPCLHVDEVLYHRWNARSGGLTDQWRSLPRETILSDLRITASRMLETIRNAVDVREERALLIFCAQLSLEIVLRNFEIKQRFGRQTHMEDINEAFAPECAIPVEAIPECWRDLIALEIRKAEKANATWLDMNAEAGVS